MMPTFIALPALPVTITKRLSPYLPLFPIYMDDALLKDFYNQHVAAITGAGSGMGRALAVKLASLGCHLALADINPENLAETASLVTAQQANSKNNPSKNASGQDHHLIRITTQTVDVADETAVNKWANQVMRDHGQVNFIFNNAGVALASSVEGTSTDELKWIMDINFWGVVYGTKAFLPLIKQSVQHSVEQAKSSNMATHNGHIINVSSLFGIVAMPTQSAYNASKFAVRGFNECLRQELDIEHCGVSSTSVHPGGIKTNIANSARRNDSVMALGMRIDERTVKRVNQMLKFDAGDAATVILMAAATNQPRVLIGDDAKIIDMVQRVFPAHYGKVLHKAGKLSSRIKKRLSKPGLAKLSK